MPLSLRRLGPYAAAVTMLIVVSVFTLVGLGEGFKLLSLKKDGLGLRKREAHNSSLSIPWKFSRDGVFQTSTSIFESDLDEANSKPIEESEVLSPVQGNKKMVSVGISKGLNAVSIVASILNEASAMLNIVVSDATATVGVIDMSQEIHTQVYTVPTGATSNLVSIITNSSSKYGTSTRSLDGSSVTSKSTATSGISIPIMSGDFIAAANKTRSLNTSTYADTTAALKPLSSANTTLPKFMLNVTSLAAPANLTKHLTSMHLPDTSHCTNNVPLTSFVTETWHSTHYESTATLYSFLNAITITCTETVTTCSQSDLLTLAAITTTPPALSSTANPCPGSGHLCTDCPGGLFCPPQQTAPQSGPCGLGWACAHCADGWFCASSGQAPRTTATSSPDAVEPTNSLSLPLDRNASALPNLIEEAETSSRPLLASLSSLGSTVSIVTVQVNPVVTLPGSEPNKLRPEETFVLPSLSSTRSAELISPNIQPHIGGLNSPTLSPIQLSAEISNSIPTLDKVEQTSLLGIEEDIGSLTPVVSIVTGALTRVLDTPIQTPAGVDGPFLSGVFEGLDGVQDQSLSTVVNVGSGEPGSLPLAAGFVPANGVLQEGTDNGLPLLGSLKNVKLEGTDSLGTNSADSGGTALGGSFPFDKKNELSWPYNPATTPGNKEVLEMVTLVISYTVIPLPALETFQSSTTHLPTATPESLNQSSGDFLKFCEANSEDNICREG